jgi:hypothetical protein
MKQALDFLIGVLASSFDQAYRSWPKRTNTSSRSPVAFWDSSTSLSFAGEFHRFFGLTQRSFADSSGILDHGRATAHPVKHPQRSLTIHLLKFRPTASPYTALQCGVLRSPNDDGDTHVRQQTERCNHDETRQDHRPDVGRRIRSLVPLSIARAEHRSYHWWEVLVGGADYMTSISTTERDLYAIRGPFVYVPATNISGTDAIHRLYSGSEHMESSSTNEGGYTFEQTLGYPWTSSTAVQGLVQIDRVNNGSNDHATIMNGDAISGYSNVEHFGRYGYQRWNNSLVLLNTLATAVLR